MAQLIGNIPWIGSLGTITAYKRRGSDKIILRTRKGPLSESVKNGENFEFARLNNSEFSGRSKVSSSIMHSMIHLKALADYNIAGPLNAILTPIQLADPVGNKGQRSILLSRYASLLNGFNFNSNYTFDTVIRTPVSFKFDKESLSAKVIIPELLRGINLFIPNNYPLYGFSVSLGLIPDFIYTPTGYRAVNDVHPRSTSSHNVYTEWFPSVKGSKELEIEMKIETSNIPSSFTLILGIGIRYATLGEGAVIDPVKYLGSPKKYIGSAKLIGTLGVY